MRVGGRTAGEMIKKLNGSGAVRIFVGTSPSGEDAEACLVLEHSLRSHASTPVEVEWLRLSRDKKSPCAGWRIDRWATPWTALRWAVPEMCGFSGRAVYFDCAQIVLGDVAELVRAEMPAGAFVLARRPYAAVETACMVFDCAEAKKHLLKIAEMREDVGAHQTVGHILSRRQSLVGSLPPGWGVPDAEYARAPDAVTGSVYFERHQIAPHGPRALARMRRIGRAHWFDAMRLPHYCARLVALWEAEYAAATTAGRSVDEYIPAEDYRAGRVGSAAESGRRDP